MDGIYYNLVKKVKEAEVTSGSYNGYRSDIVIPSTITVEGEEYAVTKIGEDAFEHCESLTSVRFPNSIHYCPVKVD